MTDDNDCGINPGEDETCDDVDNDCDPATLDGAGEPWIGVPCDGDDLDLSVEGVFQCVAGARVCSDTSGDNLELCDGLDNDNNPLTPDGIHAAWFNNPCDGPDAGFLLEGVFLCQNSARVCSDNSLDDTEANQNDCTDGLDNDGDGLIDAADPDCNPSNCTDNDSDGFAVEGGICGPADCNDNNPQVNPGVREFGRNKCSDVFDNDCDGFINCADPDCFGRWGCPQP